MTSIANPRRVPGIARIVVGGWFIASGVTTVLRDDYLVPQAQRLFSGDPGATDAPLRALLALVLAIALIPIGLTLITVGFRWTRGLPLPPEGPRPIAPDEGIAALVRREPLAFGDGPKPPYWPLRRFLRDQLRDLPWWQREVMGRGTRAFVGACGLAIAVGVVDVLQPYVTPTDWVGRYPTNFVFLLLFATAAWAVLCLLLIPPHGPRIEAFEFPLPRRAASGGGLVVESEPALLDRERSAHGVTLGVLGALVQCLTVSWWTLSSIGYPYIAMSIVRRAESIAGGIAFLVLGERMLQSAAAMLLRFRYASTLVVVAESSHAQVGYGALVRTEARALHGSRYVVTAVAGTDAREAVAALMEPR